MWMDPDLTRFENHLVELSLSGEDHRMPILNKDGTPGELDFHGHIVAEGLRSGRRLCVTWDLVIFVYDPDALGYSPVGPDEADVKDALLDLDLDGMGFVRALAMLGLAP